ncbi:hypothetical protein D3C87_1536270 [compost metagenome]
MPCHCCWPPPWPATPSARTASAPCSRPCASGTPPWRQTAPSRWSPPHGCASCRACCSKTSWTRPSSTGSGTSATCSCRCSTRCVPRAAPVRSGATTPVRRRTRPAPKPSAWPGSAPSPTWTPAMAAIRKHGAGARPIPRAPSTSRSAKFRTCQVFLTCACRPAVIRIRWMSAATACVTRPHLSRAYMRPACARSMTFQICPIPAS